MMAEALAGAGHRVTVWTNNEPGFLDDFKDFPCHRSIDLHCTKDFREKPRNRFDLVILVPHLSETLSDLYHKCVLLKYLNGAKLAILNFETPNWFNQLSPVKRDPALWCNWTQVSLTADLILSSSIEGNRYAKEFYVDAPAHTMFRHCYPSINSIVADRVTVQYRKKQIISFTRFGKENAHKGGFELLKAAAPALAGCELVVVVGLGTLEPEIKEKFNRYAEDCNFSVRFLYNLSDEQKFREIKQSAAMLFLSFFEGFGYPPIESIYSGVPCIAYDLPVLRETCGDLLHYVNRGEVGELRNTICDLLQKPSDDTSSSQKKINSIARFENYQQNLNKIVNQLFTSSKNIVSADPLYQLFNEWYWKISDEIKDVEQNLKSERKKHRFTQNRLYRIQNDLEQLYNDPFVKLRLAAGQKLKRVLPKFLSRRFRNMYEKLF